MLRSGVAVFVVLGALVLGAAPASAAIFPVDSNADIGDATPDGDCGTGPGTCTLREAIDEANALDGDDTITLPADTYDLDLSGADDTNAAGDFDVTDANDLLTIDGTGAAADAVIDGDDLDRLFDIGNTGHLALVDVTVTDGMTSSGGGIEVDGFPSTLTLTRAIVRDNVATSSGGGINVTSGSGLTDLVAVSATDSIIADNDAATGGAINNTSSDAIALTDSAVTGNDATFSGGGLNLTGSEGLTLTRTTISGNNAGSDGGGINNTSDSDPETITDSSIAGNTAARNGGGIYHTASGGPTPGLVLTRTTVSGNTATGGSGGGIYNTGSPISVTNSTFSGNGAPSAGGGAIHHTGGHVTATHVTFSGNSASQGGAINQASPTNTTLKSTILAAGPSGGACNGSPGSAGNNIASDGTCGLAGPGDHSGVDPLLGPLAPNGGPTQTHALLAGSPAIDAADNAACPPTDQRGTARPQGAGCDIGAFEVEVSGPDQAPGLIFDITGRKKQKPAGPQVKPAKARAKNPNRKVLSVKATCLNQACEATIKGKAKAQGEKLKFKPRDVSLQPGETKRVRLAGSKRQLAELKAALKDGAKGKAKIKGTASGPAGETAGDSFNVKLRGK
jgi:CSLREA domain-containing protein